MTNKLTKTVKFQVEIIDRYDPSQVRSVWTQEFIKPLVNYVSNVWKDPKGNPLALKSGDKAIGTEEANIVFAGYFFTDEVHQTLNTYGAEEGSGYEEALAAYSYDWSKVLISVNPTDDHEICFDFKTDRLRRTEAWKEVEKTLHARIEEILLEDGFVLSPDHPYKSVA